MTTDTQPKSGRKPTHVAYHVREPANGGKGFWTRIGVAWANRDGGLTVQLDVAPLDGRVVCQPADKPAAQQPAEA